MGSGKSPYVIVQSQRSHFDGTKEAPIERGKTLQTALMIYSAFIVLGNRAVKVVPALLDDVTEIVPPCAITISLVI